MNDKIIQNYMNFIKEIETERNNLMRDIELSDKNSQLKRTTLQKYDRLLERNYKLLWDIMNDD